MNFADVTPEKITWLWNDRIPMGKLTLFVGDPGLGKSFLTLFLAAQVSTGSVWPDDPLEQPIQKGHVIILSAEDDIADTILPRLITNKADVNRIKAIQGVSQSDVEGEVYFNLVKHLPALEQAVEENTGTRLVIIDPITAYLDKTDSHKNAEVRAVLAPLSALAAKRKVAVVGVSHLNKNASAKAAYRVMGSLAFTAAARSVWLVSGDKNDEGGKRRLLIPCKTNLSIDPTGLAFTIQEGRITFEPVPLNITSDQALSTNNEDTSALEEAKEFLVEELKGKPVLANLVPRSATGSRRV